MKQAKRILALVMRVVVTFVGFQFPEVTASAKAERAARGTTDVPETPDELLYSGEWAYWLEDGFAIVADYGNDSESAIRIPARLGGRAVAGIGHGAFADSEALESVQIHSNVTCIAEDAFASLSGLTIRGYHGSYALEYAAGQGFGSVNLSTQDFVEDVFDLTGAPSKSYSNLTDGSVTFRTGETAFLQEGDVVYFPPQDGYPTGLARRIGAIDRSGETAVVSLSQPLFGEVFLSIAGSDEVYLDWANAEYEEGVDLGEVGSSVSFGKSQKVSINVASFKPSKESNFTFSGSITFQIGKMNADYKMGLKWGVPYAEKLKVTMPVTTTTSVKASYEFLEKKSRIKNRATVANVPVASVGGVINGYMKVDLTFTIEGEFEISTTTETTFTFELKNSKPKLSKSEKVTKSQVKISATAKFGPELSLYFVLGWAGFSIRFFETSVGLFIKLEGSISVVTGLTGHARTVACGEIELSVGIEVSFKIGIIKVLSLDGAYFSLSKDFTVSLLKGHFDEGGQVSKCCLSDRAIVMDYGTYCKQQTADVGLHIFEPLEPTRSGYRFGGWYVNKKLSGLSGADEKWNFSTMPMPYLRNNGALYLYAKWTAVKPNLPPDPVTVPPAPKPGGSGSGSGDYLVTPTPSPVPTPTPTPAPVPPTSIVLNKTSAEMYNDDPVGQVQLTAQVLPANATDKSVVWSSSNDSIAYVDENGLVKIGNSGVATITCRSGSSPEVLATFTITVKQRVEEVYVQADGSAAAPGETIQLSALCFPTNSENKSVKWTSSDSTVATVSESGLVTGVKCGTAIITAAAQDGSGVTGTYAVTIEPELAAEANVVCDTVYLQGETGTTVAYVSATSGSVRRMAAKGAEIQWSVSGDGCVQLYTIPMTVRDNGKTYSTTMAVLYTDSLTAGEHTYNVTCTAGGASAAAEVKLTVENAAYADAVKLNPSTFYVDAGAAALIPASPVSADGNAVPEGMTVEINGEGSYDQYASETAAEGGVSVTFSESGIYSAVVRYEKANLSYEIPVSFFVYDENGVIRLKVSEIALSESYLDMVEGETFALTAQVQPEDAYNAALNWSSMDESVATVSQTGQVTAVGSGSTAILCEAADGSGCFSICAVHVESFLNLDEEKVELTLYTDGDDHCDLEIVNVSYLSQQRLEEKGLNVTWNLERVSGNSTEIALSEFVSTGEEGVAVSGNQLKLVRLSGAGEDEYRLTCTAGSFSDECRVVLTVLDDPLPESIALSETAYETVVEKPVEIDVEPVCTPAGSALPADAELIVDGTKVFRDALSDYYEFTEPATLIFDKPGVFTGSVIYAGANYEYVCPITVTVADENGNVPTVIENVEILPEEITLLTGESLSLAAVIEPENAQYSGLNWSSYDSSIATVSENGVVTAIDAGVTSITLSVPETDLQAGCLVIVEDGMTPESDTLERTVFVDGATRMKLDTVMLTEASSKRLTEAPEWTLRRVSGNNLTLRCEGIETVNEKGEALYGGEITLYSVSRTGDTVYDLTCTSGGDSATVRVTVHAVNRGDMLPASIELSQTVYEADADELILVRPEVTCWPESTQLPDGLVVSFEGGKQFIEALNAEDFFASQSLSTFSFKEPGTYEASCIFTYSNVKYIIPMTFRIRDENGNVPVQAGGVRLNHRNLNLVAGEKSTLEAVFTPVTATNQNVVWESSDPSVAAVDANGVVTAKANGTAIITCTPEDTHVEPVTCAVTVEEYLTLESGAATTLLYLQGRQVNDVTAVWLSDGTVERLERDGLTAQWGFEADSVTHSELAFSVSEDGRMATVTTSKLLSGGMDSFTITCDIGETGMGCVHQLRIADLGVTAPETVTIPETEISLAVGETAKIDFTPVCTPAGAAVPSGMTSYYVGLGDFYEAMTAYEEDGDAVTVGFGKAGRYVLTRQYFLGNLRYTTACVINVAAQNTAPVGLLEATETQFTVYTGGKSGSVSTVSVTDGMVMELWGDEIQWSAQRISGSSLTVALKTDGGTADVFVADAAKNGTDVWRIRCTFGDVTDYVDITLTADDPRGAIPESIKLSKSRLSGMIGNWITLPLGVTCEPAGSVLPDQGDDFWSFTFDALGEDVSDHIISDGMLLVRFSESGYYLGHLTYRSGNVSYTLPVYFTVTDEEDVVAAPDMSMHLADVFETVYPEGKTGVAIGRAVIAENLSTYSVNEAMAYLDALGSRAAWAVNVSDGSIASLSLKKVTANVYDIVIDKVGVPGDVSFAVSCTFGGKAYAMRGNLHVAAPNEERPDVTVGRTVYTAQVGKPLTIDRRLYSRKDGSILQSATEWNADALMNAIGYEYGQSSDSWTATFYKTGDYESTVSGQVGNLTVEVPITIKVTDENQTAQLTAMKLPAALKTVEEDAFIGVKAQMIDLRGTNVTSIGSGAFRNCVDLVAVYLPESVKYIADDAFYGCLNVTVYCAEGSFADTYARENSLTVAYTD